MLTHTFRYNDIDVTLNLSINGATIEFIDPTYDGNIIRRYTLNSFQPDVRNKIINVQFLKSLHDSNGVMLPGTQSDNGCFYIVKNHVIPEYDFYFMINTGTEGIGMITFKQTINGMLAMIPELDGTISRIQGIRPFRTTGEFYTPIWYEANSTGSTTEYVTGTTTVTGTTIIEGVETPTSEEVVTGETVFVSYGRIEFVLLGSHAGDTFSYSIDDGVTFQSSPVFTNLTEGIYKTQILSDTTGVKSVKKTVTITNTHLT